MSATYLDAFGLREAPFHKDLDDHDLWLPPSKIAVCEALEVALREVSPAVVAIEQAFFHRDPHAALVIGHARGVAMLLAARAGLTVVEYPPAMVKRTVVGSGRADKAQVTGMIRAILGLAEAPPEDAADALAVAICHASGSVLPGVAGAKRASAKPR